MRDKSGRYVAGNVPFTKGKPRPPEVIEKIAAASRGRKQSPETIEKRVMKLRGRVMSDETKRKISEARKGKPNGRLGVKLSDATRERMRISSTGKGHSAESRAKMSRTRLGIPSPRRGIHNTKMQGELNPNWKGGPNNPNTVLRKSLEYKLWRNAVFARDKYACIWCGYMGKLIEADHIKPFAYFPEMRFAIDNGRTLCRPCHKTTDTYGIGAVRKYGKKPV